MKSEVTSHGDEYLLLGIPGARDRKFSKHTCDTLRVMAYLNSHTQKEASLVYYLATEPNLYVTSLNKI